MFAVMEWEPAPVEVFVRRLLERDRFTVPGEARMLVIQALW